jgi:hypothetical protein
MRKLVALIPFLLLSCSLLAQESSATDNSIKAQFVNVIDKSNSYKEFKVIKKVKLTRLRKNISDSISKLALEIIYLNTAIENQSVEITTLTSELAKTREDLTVSHGKENGINVFGIKTRKATYNMFMWSVIVSLVMGLLLFVYKFNNSNLGTREAKIKLVETVAEFDEHRQKKLQEQQQLRRKLQDEINKNRKA